MNTIKVVDNSSPELVMNEDGEFVCLHENYHIEDDSFDFAGTHCTNGLSGTQQAWSAWCDDCGENISDVFDWDNYWEDRAEAAAGYDCD